MTPPRPTELAHDFLRSVIQSGDTVIDATAGNGHDTLMLARCVGESGRVLAFDIQAAAIDACRHRLHLAGLLERVSLHLACHSGLAGFADPASVAAVVFNLGYLPGEDHQLTTLAATTLQAIDAAITLLKPGGLLSVLCYPGHAAGATETIAVEQHLATLPESGWRVAKYSIFGTLKPAPCLFIARKNG
jgi:predicted methyltransferase